MVLAVPACSIAQVKDTSIAQIEKRLDGASSEMIRFDRQLHTGLFLGIIGGGTTFLGTRIHGGSPLTVTGGVISAVGIVISALSSTHIKRAGLILSGNGISIPLNGAEKRRNRRQPPSL